MSGPITFVMKGASEIKDTSKTLEKEGTHYINVNGIVGGAQCAQRWN